jgi:DNA-binding protein H-NS
MKGIDSKSMSINELWALHEEIASILSTKMKAEKLKLEKWLVELGHGLGETLVRQRRPYPKVHLKFRNPQPPHETWSGRGRRPRWVNELLKAGRAMEDLRIQLP